MINRIIPLETKLELIHKFFTEVWNTPLIEDDRPEPPTVAQMEKRIHQSTFLGIELLEIEGWWHKARMFYYMGGDESMLRMEGDPDLDEEKRKFVEMMEREAQIEKIMDDGDWENPVLLDYEKRSGIRFVRFPKEIQREYKGLVRDFDDDSVIIFDEVEDKEIAFDVLGVKFEGFDLTKPVTVFTSKFIRPDKSETEEKVCRIEQTESQ